MTSLDSETSEFELVHKSDKLGGLLDINPYEFAATPENLKLLDAINLVRSQFIADPDSEIKIPDILKNPIKDKSDFDYIGSQLLSDFAHKIELLSKSELKVPYVTYYSWVRHRHTFEFCDVRNMLPDHCRQNLAINLKLFEYVKLPISNYYIYNHDIEIYKFLVKSGIDHYELQVYSIWNLESFKYLVEISNILTLETREAFIEAVKNDIEDVVVYLFQHKFRNDNFFKYSMFYRTEILDWRKQIKNSEIKKILTSFLNRENYY